jgi:hypothetical protein
MQFLVIVEKTPPSYIHDVNGESATSQVTKHSVIVNAIFYMFTVHIFIFFFLGHCAICISTLMLASDIGYAHYDLKDKAFFKCVQ